MASEPKVWTHQALVDLALKWLYRPHSANGHGCNIAMAECKSGYTGEIPDAIGFKLEHPGSLSVVVEVKVSRSDFLADRKKAHRITGGMGVYRYFMCPEGMINTSDLPEGWGLLWVNSRGHIKPKAGPAASAGDRYDTWVEAMERYKQAADVVREQWLLVKLLSQVGDPEKANRERKQVYRELDAARRLANQMLSERDEARVEVRQLKRDLRLAGHKAIPREVATCE